MAGIKIKIGLLNVQSGIGTIRGYYQYLLHIRRYFRPHHSRYIERLGRLAGREGIDILATAEIEGGSSRTGGVDQAKLLAQTGNFPYSGFFPTFSVGRRVNQGNALHSRFPLSGARNHRLPGAGEPRYAGSGRINTGNREITFFVTHLSLDPVFRRAQIEELSRLVNREAGPVVLAGDFNIAHEGELDLLEKSRLQKVYSGKTFPSWKPKKRLDYIFAGREIKISAGRVLPDLLSDHRLLLVEAII